MEEIERKATDFEKTSKKSGYLIKVSKYENLP